MKCPNCGTNYSSDSQLAIRCDSRSPQVPWFRLAPAQRLDCPRCGIGLKHSRFSLILVATLGFGFLASLSLRMVYPGIGLFQFAFWFFLAAMVLGVPLLMHSPVPFSRDDS